MKLGARQALIHCLFAALSFSAVLFASASAAAADLRVVSFNVAMGAAFRKPFAGLIRSTFTNNPHLRRFDVIGLQEACSNDRRAVNLFRGVMLRAHGVVHEHSVLADPDSRESCKKAQVILSRYPFRKRGGITLPQVGARRSAAWVDLAVGRETVRVYDLHLSNRAGKNYTPTRGRWAQASVVLDHWMDERAKDPRKRGIVLGDFNTTSSIWEPHKPEITVSSFCRHMTPNMLRFVPTMFVPYKTDWIFSNGLSLKRSHVIPTIYSDHFVVVADYRL
jgi:endonuclease/exonuclease/phosphatase family metal-dependent hydrolase